MSHEQKPGYQPGKLNSHCFQIVEANGEKAKAKAEAKERLKGERVRMFP